MITLLEHLPNEILLDLLECIDGRDLHHGFWGLNIRINNLIRSLNNLSFVLGENDEEVIPIFAKQVRRLEVINTGRRTFDLSHFSDLHSLTLFWATGAQLAQIRPETIPNLVYLSSTSEIDTRASAKLANYIFANQFPFLRYVRLDLIAQPDIQSWSGSPSIHFVYISCRNLENVLDILISCPNLYHLHVDYLNRFFPIHPRPVIDNHPLRQLVLSDTRRILSSGDVDNLLSFTPNVERFKLKFLCDVSFKHLLQTISNRLLRLCRFDCRIIQESMDETIDMDPIRQTHPCFDRIQCQKESERCWIYTTE